MMIAVVLVLIIIVAAAAAVLLTQPNTPTEKPTNYLDKGFSLEIYYNSGNSARQTAAELMKTNLESLNPGKIHITVTGVEWSQYLALQRAGAMPAFFLGWAPDYADPNDYTVPFLLGAGTYLHTIGYVNATLDAKVSQSATELNVTARANELHQIALDVQKECLYVWVSQGSNLNAQRTWITGFEFNPMYSNLYYYLLNKTAGTSSNPVNQYTFGEISGNPDFLDPAQDYETAGGEVLQNVFETLVFYDGGQASTFIPMLATEIPTVANGGISANGLNYTFHIREGVKFHDNASFLTAADVKYSIERELRLNDPNGPAWILGEVLVPDYYNGSKYGAGTFNATGVLSGGIDSQAVFDGCMWVKNSTTIQFNLTANDPAFVSRLAFNSASIVSLNNTNANSANKPYSEAAFHWVNTHPIGTGAYKFLEFVPDSHVALERFNYYWQAPAKIERILLQQVPTDNARVSGLLDGTYDGAIIPRSVQESLYGAANVELTNSSAFNVNFLGLNQEINTTALNPTLNDIPSGFFKDLKVRQAFAHAWDFATFNAQVLKGTAVQPNGVVPKGMFGYFSDVPDYAFNLTTAKALLKAAALPATASSATYDVITEFVAKE
jgi:peptide/nickel transport system substrate-binding protein